MKKREYRNRDNSVFSDIIRRNLKELEDEEFILQIPLEKEVTDDEREVRTRAGICAYNPRGTSS